MQSASNWRPAGALQWPTLRKAGTGILALVAVAVGLPRASAVDAAEPAPAVRSAQPESLPDFIYCRLEAGEKTIRIPAGEYRVVPDNGTHLRLENLHGVTLDGTGVTFICTETTRAILAENCTDLKLKGFTIDYDPLPFTQGTIVEISPDRKSHTVEIQAGFPPAESATTFKHSIYTPEGELRYGEYHNLQLEVLPGNRLRIFDLHPNKDGGEQLGDTVVISSEHLTGRYDPHAVHLDGCTGTVIEDVTLYASPCFGFYEERSSGSVYRRCVIDRKPGRLHSLNADAFHSKFARVGPQILSCSAGWMGDDAVNICGSYHVVTGVEGDRVRVLAKRSLDIEVGDTVQLLDRDGRRLPEATVLAIESDGTRTDADTRGLEELNILPPVRELLKRSYLITLDVAPEMAFGGVIGSSSRMGNGFTIRDCTFGHNRSRGILVKASDGEISGNRLTDSRMQAIKVAPEYIWLESGYSEDLIIRDNIIERPGAQAILIGAFGPWPIHRAIDIINNTIVSDVFPCIEIQGLDDGIVEGNSFHRLDGSPVDNPVWTH
ncbi:right-handed parallel beta-helix repeat-containing protein [Ruficoccus amylovorans]|uniref:Right-handed parallel beta-helix repeat-containing protein n=1 Tax=Ruficoccus amylovorans TaxID=1804625 RepID=A0A842HHU2_9BACT|nr:right-handed parallel beta-helix repeat-containing protein [Ruficoccus amylovorans]MBC2595740.1 right-handed parallel beta-helix repeat-containing protein [Ruficoccus amylovorans]